MDQRGDGRRPVAAVGGRCRERWPPIGIGLGGLLAYEAAASGAVDDVVLWATPGSGRSFVRELVAFSAHETARIVESGRTEPPPLPEGWLAPGGFLLSPETNADLRSLDLATRPLRSPPACWCSTVTGSSPMPG